MVRRLAWWQEPSLDHFCADAPMAAAPTHQRHARPSAHTPYASSSTPYTPTYELHSTGNPILFAALFCNTNTKRDSRARIRRRRGVFKVVRVQNVLLNGQSSTCHPRRSPEQLTDTHAPTCTRGVCHYELHCKSNAITCNAIGSLRPL